MTGRNSFTIHSFVVQTLSSFDVRTKKKHSGKKCAVISCFQNQPFGPLTQAPKTNKSSFVNIEFLLKLKRNSFFLIYKIKTLALFSVSFLFSLSLSFGFLFEAKRFHYERGSKM